MKLPHPIRLLAVIALFPFVSCQQGEETASEPEQEPSTASEPQPVADGDGAFVGLPLKEAESLAEDRELPHRVVKVDGESKPVTMDYRPDRLNFTIEKGVVVSVSRG